MRIAKLNIPVGRYGGQVYGDLLAEALGAEHKFEQVDIGNTQLGSRYFKALSFFFSLFRFRKRDDYELVIREFDSCFFLNGKLAKQVVIIHHIDFSLLPLIYKAVYLLMSQAIFFHARRADAVVVVSKYWEEYLKKNGFKNTHLIYNAFDIQDSEISNSEVEAFRRKHGLSDKPIVYLGNCQPAKGVAECYKALQHLPVHLVTSGKPQIALDAVNLDLGYKDYLTLLKSSAIVLTMSKFKEGWCRTAHEAMLQRTPVIGSGLGGMRELLQGGGQIICEKFSDLRGEVESLLCNAKLRKEIGENGQAFASQFGFDRFKADWQKLLTLLELDKGCI